MLALLLLACAPEQSVVSDVVSDPPIGSGAITGRICQADGDGWQENAQVSTHIMQGGTLLATVSAWTDRAGRFLLEDLPQGQYDLLVQVGTERLQEQEAQGLDVVEHEVLQLAEPDCGEDPTDVELAVVVGSYDSVELVLDDLGYTNTVLVDGLDRDALLSFLLDRTAMAAFDMVLVDGGHLEEGVLYATGPEEEQLVESVTDSVKAYVEGGGTLLASDWAYDLVERTWPEQLAFLGDDGSADSAQLGEAGSVRLTLLDPGLAAAVGDDYLVVDFDLPDWPAISATSDTVAELAVGDVEIDAGTGARALYDSPLLVRFDVGQGTVYFSSFPFAANRDTGGELVLEHLIRVR